jgi:hypothetical protein
MKPCGRGIPRKDHIMASTEQGKVEQLLELGSKAQEDALEAVRKFLDTVDSVFPHTGEEGPRRKIIDSAFQMTEQLVGTWTQVAEKIVKVTGEALAQPKDNAGSSK